MKHLKAIAIGFLLFVTLPLWIIPGLLLVTGYAAQEIWEKRKHEEPNTARH